MLWALANWQKIVSLSVGLLTLFVLVGLYTWARSEQASRITAEASLAQSRAELEASQKSLADLIASNKAMDEAMSIRDTEHQETQERLSSASAELRQLRRQNAELRDWLDRPIPADVVRMLREGAGQDRKTVSTKDTAR